MIERRYERVKGQHYTDSLAAAFEMPVKRIEDGNAAVCSQSKFPGSGKTTMLVLMINRL